MFTNLMIEDGRRFNHGPSGLTGINLCRARCSVHCTGRDRVSDIGPACNLLHAQSQHAATPCIPVHARPPPCYDSAQRRGTQAIYGSELATAASTA